ncbi:hypothetical protein SEA_TYPHA_93 [Mycobacterium phage Typha]|uniref:ARB-07466-like C-terminal domain-containing protein n=1 Tax=Mycobacterium phage Typha TaxID=2517971 RepID=A0A482JAK9_9CAUD|nr:endolysin [Mycobacterium phage Typha]QBP29748.1 hypothetical protein SEA_TYPHA_93 [Mycobacterium phage Typha]URM86536.1 hypothetical protein PBI_HILLTOPFARM_97 [Mycobacterium phage Hilltopfarm]
MIRVLVIAAAAMLAATPTAHASPVRPDTARVERYVRAHYPEVGTIGTVRSDRLPDHPSGRACDLMVPGWDTPEGKALGDRMADDLLANAGPLGIKYVIWRQEYRTPGGVRRRMANRGNATQNHYNHVHVTTWGDQGTEAL